MNPRIKRLITIYCMGAGYAVVYALPFIQYVFYDPLIQALGSTNQQLGVLIALFGIGNLLAPIGGWLADRFNYKIVYMVGIVSTSLMSILFAMNMNYTFALITWAILAVTALVLFFPSHTKAIRLLGDAESQGQMFGLAESAAGIGSVVINAIAIWLFTMPAVETIGLRNVIIGYGVFGLIVSVVVWFLLRDRRPDIEEKGATNPITVKDFISVLKYPGTWLAGLAIFCAYSLYVSLSYFTPYFTDVFGLGAATVGTLGVIRTYVIRFVGAPLGGMLGDKLKSVTKVLLVAFIGAIIVTVVVLQLPVGTSLTVLVILSLLLSVVTYVARGNMFAVPAEVKSPERFAAMTAGITCAIGYSPDLFQFQLFGSWLDNLGNDGYRNIFIYTIAIMIVGVLNSLLTFYFKKTKKFGQLG